MAENNPFLTDTDSFAKGKDLFKRVRRVALPSHVCVGGEWGYVIAHDSDIHTHSVAKGKEHVRKGHGWLLPSAASLGAGVVE